MKNKFLALAASAMFLFACSDDASTQANGASTQGNESSAQSGENSGNGKRPSETQASSVYSSCKADESFFEYLDNMDKSVLEKSAPDDTDDSEDIAVLDWEPDRYFKLEVNEDSVLVEIEGVVEACNKVIESVDLRLGGDTLYTTLVYRTDVETNCFCTGAGVSFKVAQEYADIKTIVIGDEVFPYRSFLSFDGCSDVNLPEGCECYIDMIVCPVAEDSLQKGNARDISLACQNNVAEAPAPDELLDIAVDSTIVLTDIEESTYPNFTQNRSDGQVNIVATELMLTCGVELDGIKATISGDTLYAELLIDPLAPVAKCICPTRIEFTLDAEFYGATYINIAGGTDPLVDVSAPGAHEE